MIARIGRYQVLSELGEGGFGKVYLAIDPTLNSRRAIKVMSAPDDPSLRIRFKNEAVAAASLNHPNIVRILEYGEENDQPYIVMEYLEGNDLAKRLSAGPPFTLFQKVNILQQVASGLFAAHSHRSAIIHRDIKPANVMILPDGTAKIMDFGIARLAGDSRTRLTSTNVMIGSIGYMAPEQFTSGMSDVRSDIWSFGVLAYELIAEQHPFPAKDATPGQVMYRITTVDPTPVNQVVRCPAELANIVSKAMSKNRELRYPTLEDAVFDLDVVRVDLRKSEAGQILNKAQEFYSVGEFETALKTVRDALEVDSQLKSARDLREKLQAEIQKRAARARVDTGLHIVADALDRGDLDAAVAELESICLLDPGDDLLGARLQELRTMQQRRRQVEQVLQNGERALTALDLDAASASLDEAEAMDPAAPQIPTFRERLSRALALKRQQEDVRRIVKNAEGEASEGRFGNAIRYIGQGLEVYPNDPSLLECSKRYAHLERQESAALESARASVQHLLDRGELNRAKATCLEAIRRYPRHEQLKVQLAEIEKAEKSAENARQRQQSAEKLKREAEKIRLEVRRALATLNLEEAIARAEEAVRRFPDEAEFRLILAETRALQVQRATATEQTAAEPTSETTHTAIDTEATAGIPFSKVSPHEVPPTSAPRRSKPLFWVSASLVVVVGAIFAYKAMTRHVTIPPEHISPVQAWSVSPTSLEFEITQDRRPPEGRRITVRPAIELAIQSPAWIRVEQNASKDSTSLLVTVLADKLPSGPAEGSITMASLTGSSQSVFVRAVSVLPATSHGSIFPPSSKGWVRADIGAIDFTSTHKEVEIRVSSDGPPRQFRVGSDAEWIAINKQVAQTPAVLQVFFRADKLVSASRAGTITILPVDTALEASHVQVKVELPNVAKDVSTNPPTTPIIVPPPPRATPKPNQRWTGGLEGELRLRRAFRPGEVVELNSSSPGVEGLSDFPWLYETRVQVRVVSPQSLVIETQPGKTNDWNLLRVRLGAEPAQLVILGWQIPP